MRLIVGQSVDEIAVESPIIFSGIDLHGCPVGGEVFGGNVRYCRARRFGGDVRFRSD